MPSIVPVPSQSFGLASPKRFAKASRQAGFEYLPVLPSLPKKYGWLPLRQAGDITYNIMDSWLH